VKYLLEHGADPHAENNEAIQLAYQLKRTDVVKCLLDYGAKPLEEKTMKDFDILPGAILLESHPLSTCMKEYLPVSPRKQFLL
jgi:hypothetical protein